MSNKPSFLDELKRRNVIRMAGLYLVGAWLLVQVAGTLLPVFDAPAWVMKSLVGLLAVGLVPALIFSWVFELTPQGLKRDQDVVLEQSIAPQTGRRMNRMIIAVLVLALGYFAVDKFVLAPRRVTVPNDSLSAVNKKSIAVLPFENLSGNADNAYFVSGMQDLILTNLSKIRDLKVISRTSTEKYASRPANLKVVGAELGVATILEGSVQRAGDKVLINLQLIDANTDTHLWAEAYNRKTEDVFAVEQEVSKTVADALKATLLPAETAAIAAKPTEDPAAYDLFLRAEYLFRQGSQNHDRVELAQAIALYRQAIAKDPKFALANAQLSIALSDLYWNGGTPDVSLPALARQSQAATAEAKRLRPELPEADLALAFLKYRTDLNFPAAVAAFDAVLAVRPGDLQALWGKALTLRRLGRFAEAIAALETAVTLSPRDSNLAGELGVTYWLVRRNADAETELQRALVLDPDNVYAETNLSNLLVYRKGDFSGAWAVLRGDRPEIVLQRVELLRLQRKDAAALQLLAPISEEAVSNGAVDAMPKALLAAILHLGAGEPVQAEPLLRQAKVALQARLGSLPDNYGNGQSERVALADTEALLGDEAAALATTRQALTQLPVEKDAFAGAITLAQAVKVYARLGRADLVMPILERLRLLPGADESISASTLTLDPVWDKVRDDPGFQAEIKRFAEFDQP